MAQTVVAVFDSHQKAVHGVEELRKEGFRADQISIFVPDPREAAGFGEEVGIHVVQGGLAGVAAGGLIGGIAGWLVGLGGLVIPGAGFVLAAGPVAAAVAGAVSGASLGGFVGMLVGLGLPHHAAQEYEQQLREGRTLVFVHPGEEFGIAEVALYRAHPFGLHHYEELIGGEAAAGPDQAPLASSGDQPGGRVEPAAPDRVLSPSDVAVSIDGQELTGRSQHLDQADLRPKGGAQDT